MRAAICIATALLALGGCSKKKKPAATAVAQTTAGSGSAEAAPTDNTPPTGSAAVATGEIMWNDAPDMTPHPAPPLIADPDALIAKYGAECPANKATDACKAMRSQVEHVLLDQMIGLRSAGVPIDLEWNRVAIAARTPQLACLGVFGLLAAKARTPADDTLLLAALDHASPHVRYPVMAANIPAIAALLPRRAMRPPEVGTGTCIDASIDPEYGPKWAGGYPGVKFRFFASNDERRWFTTSDSVEKVLAFFTKSGQTVMTRGDYEMTSQQKMMDELVRMQQQQPPQEGDMKPEDQQKLVAQMQAITAKYDIPKLDNIQDAGEMHYVLIAPNVPIVIFKDDILKATSIVALQPKHVPDDPMLAKAKPIEVMKY